MPKGKKDYGKVVRKVKNKKSKTKIDAIHTMVESIIKGDVELAEESLNEYLQQKTRELILGESEECLDCEEENIVESDDEDSDKDKKDSDKKDSDDEDEDDDDDEDDEDSDEDDEDEEKS